MKLEAREAIRNAVTGPQNIIICEPDDSTGDSVSMSDFGVFPGSGTCCYEAFRKAIEFCRDNNVRKLVVPGGVYLFLTEPEEGKAQLQFEGLNNFTFDAQGSEFIFSVAKVFLGVKNCEQVTFKNFCLDWDWSVAPLASAGRVIEVDSEGRYFDCEFPAYEQIGNKMDIQIVGPLDPITLTPGCRGGLEFRPYENKHVSKTSDQETDKSMAELVRELSNIIAGMEKIKDNVMRFFAVDPKWCAENMKPGQVYNFRHYEYDTVGVALSGSSHVTFKEMTLYSCPGSGIVGSGDLHHFQFLNCKITRRPGTDRTISSTADCLHIANSTGYFKIENCEFSHAGDDCINIHDNTSMGVKVTGCKSIIAERIRKGRNEFHVGDVIEFRNGDLSPAGFSSKLTAVEYIQEEASCIMSFEDDLPDTLKEDTIVFNRRYDTSNYIIRNNTFHSGRARGILIHGSNGLIEGNRFYRIQGAAVQMEAGAESRWAEGTGIKNVIFRNNWIESCDVNRWVMAVIYMGVYLPKGRTAYPIFDGVIFEKNTVVGCPRLAFFLSSCANILVSGNVIINPNTEANSGSVFGSSQRELPVYGEKYMGTIMVSHGSNVVIEGNKRIETVQTAENGICCGERTSNIYTEGNYGFDC